MFDRVDSFSWETLGDDETDVPQVLIDAIYRGHPVSLEVPADAPEDEEPGMEINTTRRKP